MKQTQIAKVVAELEAETVIVHRCMDIVEAGNSLAQYHATLLQCIDRLSTPSSVVAPKPTRTRKGKGLPKPEAAS